MRVLASGYGDVLYSELLISPLPNSLRPLKSNDSVDPLAHVRNEVLRGNISYEIFEILLKNPNSRLFLNTREIVSNYAKGSVPVPLNGTKVEEKWLAEQVDLLGIDPSNPQLPKQVADISQQIGVLTRAIWPYAGIDYIPNSQADFVYLETNRPPQLAAEMVPGARPNMNGYKLQNLLLQNIARSRKARK